MEASQRPVDLIAEGFDVAIRIGGAKLQDSDLIAIPLMSQSSGLFATETYLRRILPIRSVEDLKQQSVRCLAMSPQQNSWCLRHIADMNDSGSDEHIHFEPRHVFGSMTLLHEATLQGLGISCLEKRMIHADVLQARLIPVLPEWQTPTIGLYALIGTRVQSYRVRRFIEELKMYFDDQS